MTRSPVPTKNGSLIASCLVLKVRRRDSQPARRVQRLLPARVGTDPSASPSASTERTWPRTTAHQGGESSTHSARWDPRARGWPFDAHALAWLDGRAGGSFGATGSFCDFYRGWRGAALRYPPAGGRHATRMEALLLQAPGSSWWRENGSDAVGVGDGAERPMVLWLHLEALLREPGREAARLAAFLGLDASDGRLIDGVVSDATFGALREAELQAGGRAGGGEASDELTGRVLRWSLSIPGRRWAGGGRTSLRTRACGGGWRRPSRGRRAVWG